MPRKTSPLKADPDDVYLSSNQVRKRYGETSDMSFWRWLNNAKMNFPKPIFIQRRRFWRLSDLVQWERQRAKDAA